MEEVKEELRNGLIHLSIKREAVKNMDGFEIESWNKPEYRDVDKISLFALYEAFDTKTRTHSISAIIKEK